MLGLCFKIKRVNYLKRLKNTLFLSMILLDTDFLPLLSATISILLLFISEFQILIKRDFHYIFVSRLFAPSEFNIRMLRELLASFVLEDSALLACRDDMQIVLHFFLGEPQLPADNVLLYFI